MRLKVIFITFLLLAPLTPSISATPPKAGAICSKAGVTNIYSGKKFTCIKSGKKLVWDKGVLIKKTSSSSIPTPQASPSPTPTPSPTSNLIVDFPAWSLDIDSKMLNDQAQRNFINWTKGKIGMPINHIQLIETNANINRITILKKADDLGAMLFSAYFPQGSKTFIGASEKWTVERLNESGWSIKNCNEPYMQGVALCLDRSGRQGYVVTSDATYNASEPGSDGGALLAHEYFHLVQFNLAKHTTGSLVKTGEIDSTNAVPVWFLEGSADFVGFSVGALAQNATYWEGRSRMLSYSPPEESINKNSIADYEIRTCCGNNSPTYPYHVGRIASEYIVASIGFQKMLDIWIDYAKTRNFEKSFENITGLTKEQFYQRFDQVRTKIGLPPISWRLEGLVNKKIGN